MNNEKAEFTLVHKASGTKFYYDKPIVYFGRFLENGCYIVQFGKVYFIQFGGEFKLQDVTESFEISNQTQFKVNTEDIHKEKYVVPENVALYKKIIDEKDYRDKLKPISFSDFFKELMANEELMIIWKDEQGCLNSTPVNRRR